MVFHRQRTTNFVRDMVLHGLLQLTAAELSLAAACESVPEPRAATGGPDRARLKSRLPSINQSLLGAQRESMKADPSAPEPPAAEPPGPEMPAEPEDSVASATAFWQTYAKPSVAMAHKIREFEAASDGFTLSPEKRTVCRWFGEAMDVTLRGWVDATEQ